ncbi:MAG: gliding motility-associated C-terminal domain-containing protein [Cryomorphaceae bacterium]|jgi:gliding motility-associated-like protein|nr:gliding motility-associated C-terminal domain-containing protein [Cryomorphaceae bacterium]
MTEKDQIKELFAKGLQDHQVQLDPALWSSISSSIGTGAAKTGLGLLAKTLIGVAASAVVAGAVYLSLEQDKPAPKKQEGKTLQEAKKPIESKEIIITKSTKPSIQTLHYDPLPIGCFPIIDDTEFGIPDFDAQPYSGTNAEVQAFTSAIEPQNVPVVNPTQGQLVQQIATPSQIAPIQEAQAKKTTPISLPNIFTPNGDGQNEALQINWDRAEVQDFSIVVLDAQNKVVFKSSDPEFSWNGTDLGEEKLPRGNYIYFVSAVIDGQKWQQSSNLQIQY